MNLEGNLNAKLINQLRKGSNVPQLLVICKSALTDNLVFFYNARSISVYDQEWSFFLSNYTFGLQMRENILKFIE